MIEKIISLNEAELTEAFDTAEGYEVVNMKPDSGAPQIFMIKNDAEEDLIVRMMALSGDGDKLRVLKPSDKNVIVELMSINDRGRHTVLRGGIGSNPMKTIVTIFDTVVENLNLNIIDSIMFRFQGKKMGGQVRIIQKILDRLASTRGKGKFVPLKELENFTGKFSYVVLHKRKVELEKLPGAKNVDEKYKKVETAVGEVFVDDKTGKQVSKAEVIAQAIVDTVSKISDKEVVQKTKLSKMEIIRAQYAPAYSENGSTAVRKRYQALMAKQTVIKATSDNQSGLDGDVNSSIKNQTDRIKEKIETGFKNAIEKTDPNEMQFDASASIANRWFELNKDKYDKQTAINLSLQLAAQYERVVASITLENSYDKLQEIVSLGRSMGFEDKPYIIAEMIREAVKIVHDSTVRNLENYKQPGLTEEQQKAIAKYAGQDFKKINQGLIGTDALSVVTEKLITEIDNAIIEHGISLAKGTKVYRGMSLTKSGFDKVRESRVFYFKNFVSTSLAPIIFTSYGAVTVSKNIVSNVDGEDEFETIETSGLYIPLGLVISGADQIKVVIPGKLSKYNHEAEVILPRGVVIKFGKAISSKLDNGGAYLIETEIINPEDLQESVEVFDGDHLMETGELKLVENKPTSFSSFDKKLQLQDEMDKIESKEMLADLFADSVSSLPYKFMQA